MKLPILIIEDDKFMLDLTSSALESSYKIFKAQSINEANDIIKKNIIRLVLTDINLGDENSCDFINDLRESETTTDIPIVVYSGVADKNIKSSLLKNGIAGFIEKPISLAELEIRIEKSLVHFSNVCRNKMTQKVPQENIEIKTRTSLSGRFSLMIQSFANSIFASS